MRPDAAYRTHSIPKGMRRAHLTKDNRGNSCALSLARQSISRAAAAVVQAATDPGQSGSGRTSDCRCDGSYQVLAVMLAQTIERRATNINTDKKNRAMQALSEFHTAVLFCYFLRRATPANPSRPEPNNQTAAGTGTTAGGGFNAPASANSEVVSVNVRRISVTPALAAIP